MAPTLPVLPSPFEVFCIFWLSSSLLDEEESSFSSADKSHHICFYLQIRLWNDWDETSAVIGFLPCSILYVTLMQTRLPGGSATQPETELSVGESEWGRVAFLRLSCSVHPGWMPAEVAMPTVYASTFSFHKPRDHIIWNLFCIEHEAHQNKIKYTLTRKHCGLNLLAGHVFTRCLSVWREGLVSSLGGHGTRSC